MSDFNYEEVLKSLGMGNEEGGEKPPAIELKDPATGQAVKYNSPAEAQAAIDAMYRNFVADKQQLLETLKPTAPAEKTVEKIPSDNNPYNLTEAELKKFNKMTETDPHAALEFLVTKSPKWQQMENTVQSLAAAQANAQAMVTAQTFLNNHRAEMVDSPNATVIQNEVSQLVKALVPPGQAPSPLHLEVAFNNLKVLKPELFQTTGQNPYPTQGVTPYQTNWGAAPPAPPPVPNRGGSSPVGGMNFTETLAKIYDDKGPDAAKRYLDMVQSQGARY